MAWIPVMAAGIINGFGHYWGYRNFACADASTNIVPWGILIGGEELHNNHHAYGTSAKLSSRWYEFDIGWTYIRILEILRLADVRKVAPKLRVEPPQGDSRLRNAAGGDREPLRRRHRYARTLKATCAAELARLRERAGRGEFAHVPSVRRLKRWLSEDALAELHERERATLARAMEKSKALSTIYAMRQELNVAVGALDRIERAAARAPAGLVPARRGVGHRAARAVLAAAQALRIAAPSPREKPADRRAFLSRDPAPAQKGPRWRAFRPNLAARGRITT